MSAFPRQTLEGIWLTIKGSTLKGAQVSVVHGAYKMLLAECFELSAGAQRRSSHAILHQDEIQR